MPQVDISALNSENTATEKQYVNSENKYTEFSDAGGILVSELLKNVFPDYLASSSAKILPKISSGSTAEFSVLGNSISRLPKQSFIADKSGVGLSGTVSTDEVLNNLFVYLHEITHARSPIVNTRATVGAPSPEAVQEMLTSAIDPRKNYNFPSQGEKGDLEELVASLLPIRDMNARNIFLTGTRFGGAQKGYSDLRSQYPWLDNFLSAQSQPEKKFKKDSPQMIETPKSFTDFFQSLDFSGKSKK